MYATSQAVPWRPSGIGVLSRPGRIFDARRPSGVSIRPGASRFARTPRREPSSATWRGRPAGAALEGAYDGAEVPGRGPATGPTETRAVPPGSVRRAGPPP